MTSWRSKTNLLSFIVIVIIFQLSKQDCPYYFELEYLKHNLAKRIPLIRTKDPKNVLECSFERKALNDDDDDFRSIVQHCFNEDRIERFTTIHEKCEGDPYGSVLFYNAMCMLAAHKNLPAPACETFDAVCQFQSTGSPIAYDSTTVTPTTLPERTTALPPNTTPVQPSPTTNATSTNATSTNATSTNATSTNATSTNATSTNPTSTNATSTNATSINTKSTNPCGQIKGQVSPNSTAAVSDCSEANSWKIACVFLLILCVCLAVLCLFSHRRMMMERQLLLVESQPGTDGSNESENLMKSNTSENTAEGNSED